MDKEVSDEEKLERQYNEISLLQTMYPDEMTITKAPASSEDAEVEIRLDKSHTLVFTLPSREYPVSVKPHVLLDFGSHVPNSDRKELRARLKDVVEQQESGVECVDLIIGDFKSQLESFEILKGASGAGQDAEKSSNAEKSVKGMRVVLWMHHLLATSKRKAILQLSKELGLAGFSKPGYPGSVYVEGEAEAVRSFVDELKSMRWQAIQERATDEVLLSSLTLLGKGAAGVREVEGLGDISEGLMASGPQGPMIAQLFLESMKIK